MRAAAIDIGTNTVLLLVAERGADGQLVAVEERATITRLGEGVDKTRRLLPAAIERTNAAIDAYADIVRQLGVDRVDVVGTSAMRDAAGGEAVRDHVQAKLGVPARTIPGDEEARLTFAGALRVARKAPQGSSILCMLPDTGERYLSTPLFADVPVDMTPEEIAISRSTPTAQMPG